MSKRVSNKRGKARKGTKYARSESKRSKYAPKAPGLGRPL